MKEIMSKEHILFVTNKDGFYNVLNQIREIDKDFDQDQILIEPMSLNTAPAIALAVKHIEENLKADPKDPIIFLPADHFIGNRDTYLAIVKNAMSQAGGYIKTIGITPTKPETGYGYIRKGRKSVKEDFFEVLEFKEKPDKETAEKYLRSKEYSWNSGMYLFNTKTFSEELSLYSPEIYRVFAQGFAMLVEKFKELPSISMDCAISEKSKKMLVFEGDFGWNDIGSFDSIAENFQNDQNSRHINVDSKNIYVHTDSNRLVATLGVEDLNIIETADSILIQKRGRGEDVKKVIEHLKERNAKELTHNLIVHRPWGKHEIITEDVYHRVCRTTIYPGAKLSFHKHYHRTEHLIVVRGIASIVSGVKKDSSIFLKENQSMFIPSNTPHYIENPGRVSLEMVEIQTGNYFGEDDNIQYDSNDNVQE